MAAWRCGALYRVVQLLQPAVEEEQASSFDLRTVRQTLLYRTEDEGVSKAEELDSVGVRVALRGSHEELRRLRDDAVVARAAALGTKPRPTTKPLEP